ncbi:MAG: 30S ribosomal protein S21 [Candidatus Caenarcaniphilales bacterium]|nr:30S ribosomal protein S21 [Candidatus Caenarcaniphilales bacterium]
MIEVTRDENEPIDSLIKRFRRQVTKHKVLQEVKQRAFFVSESIQRRLKKRRNERKKRRRPY